MPLNPMIGLGGGNGPHRAPAATARYTFGREADLAGAKRSSSKKGYTGTRAGLGRGYRDLRRQTAPTTLPPRARGTAAQVEFHPAASSRPPSLMTRIGQRIRRSAAALGL
jgi:hypothetical protein